MSTEIIKTSQIRIDVHLDKESLPSQIEWDADDADFDGKQAAKGVMLAIFDGLQQNAMRIDLWTNDMQVDEMNLFMFQTLATMADTFEKATNNKEVADEMRDFAHRFGHRVDVFGPDHKH
ncbi:MAG: gliding motility protein GldC [Bacteroidetes bacterium]|nr:gliding motility protein GldC [Bacteroidota bacterium]